MTRLGSIRALLFLSIVAVAPDFDFALVWGLGLPVEVYHRTFSHSLLAGGLVAGLFHLARPGCLRSLPAWMVGLVYLSHPLLDMICTADAADHGVMLFWPLSDLRLGWPLLVPLYRWFAESPFTPIGALSFTALEAFLALPLWISGRLMARLSNFQAAELHSTLVTRKVASGKTD